MNNTSIKRIPIKVVSRLPKYYIYLKSIVSHKDKITSSQLSRHVGVSPGVIRHDLHFFGRYGKHGCGYDVKYLYKEIGNILRLNITYNAVIIGTGNIGNALCKYYNSLTEFLKDNSIDIGIICVPIKAAHNICDNYLQVE